MKEEKKEKETDPEENVRFVNIFRQPNSFDDAITSRVHYYAYACMLCVAHGTITIIIIIIIIIIGIVGFPSFCLNSQKEPIDVKQGSINRREQEGKSPFWFNLCVIPYVRQQEISAVVTAPLFDDRSR
jgi:hypothetical protein